MQHRHHDTLTYRFPRNTLEAFGPDATTACAVERHTFRTQRAVRWVLRFSTVGLVMAFIVWGLI